MIYKRIIFVKATKYAPANITIAKNGKRKKYASTENRINRLYDWRYSDQNYRLVHDYICPDGSKRVWLYEVIYHA